MPLPVNSINKDAEAESILRHLKTISRDADYAKSLNNADVLRLYLTIFRASNAFNDLAAAGYTVEVLGPILGAKLDINWNSYQQLFLDLKNVHGTAFVTAFLTHQTEILQQQISGDLVSYKPISTATKAVLLPLINNISDLFAG